MPCIFYVQLILSTHNILLWHLRALWHLREFLKTRVAFETFTVLIVLLADVGVFEYMGVIIMVKCKCLSLSLFRLILSTYNTSTRVLAGTPPIVKLPLTVDIVYCC